MKGNKTKCPNKITLSLIIILINSDDSHSISYLKERTICQTPLERCFVISVLRQIATKKIILLKKEQKTKTPISDKSQKAMDQETMKIIIFSSILSF